MNPPLISVVMGVYNNADTLPAALESVLSQEEVELEFIVIDDGSTDGSAEILDEAARQDPRLRVVHQTNQGLTRALIAGCVLARAPWIARQDADDVSLPGRLAAQLARAQQPDMPDLVVCGIQTVSPEGDVLFEVIPPADPAAARRQLVESRRALSAHGTMFFRKAAYEAAGGYCAEFYYAQDVDLAIRLAERGPVAVVPAVQYRFRYSPGSITGRANRWQWAFYRLILRSQAARRQGRSDQAVLAQAARLASRCRRRNRRSASSFAGWYFLGCCLLPRNPGRAAEYLRNALRIRPWSLRAWFRWLQARSRKAGR